MCILTSLSLDVAGNDALTLRGLLNIATSSHLQTQTVDSEL